MIRPNVVILVRTQGAPFDVESTGTAGFQPAYEGQQDAGGPRGYVRPKATPLPKR